MAKLHGLIRFRRHDLDEKRRILAELNSELERLQMFRQKTIDDLAREKNLAAVDLECARHFPAYLDKMTKQIELQDQVIAFKTSEVQAATHVVQEAYLEVKKLEITQERRDQEEADRIKKIEGDTLDEIGLQAFRKNQEEK
jgi:flagellar FliJ protein